MSAKSTSLRIALDFVLMQCGQCDIRFYVTEEFEDSRRRNGLGWYCPNGHSRVYTKSEATKERERADALERQLANRDEDLRAERAAHTATKGQLTKVSRRADRGVCQHCHRSFVNVQRHVAHMHPEAVSS